MAANSSAAIHLIKSGDGNEMSGLRDAALSLALSALNPGTSAEQVTVYFDEQTLAIGGIVETGTKSVKVGETSHLIFIDLVPQANWGHPCRYILMGVDGKELAREDGTMPPFLRGAAKSLVVIWQGAAVPDWTLGARRPAH